MLNKIIQDNMIANDNRKLRRIIDFIKINPSNRDAYIELAVDNACKLICNTSKRLTITNLNFDLLINYLILLSGECIVGMNA